MDNFDVPHSAVANLDEERAKRLASKRYTEVFTLLHAKWYNVLKLQEAAVLQFINIRTYKYGKPSEYIARRHFLQGVFTQEGAQLHAGLPIGLTSLKSALRALEGHGLIKVTHNYKSGRQVFSNFEINFNKLEAGPDMSKLNMPKNLREGSSGDGGGVASRREGVRHATPVNSLYNKQIINSTIPPQAGGLEDAIQTATHKNRESRKRKRTSLNIRVTKSGVKALWQELLIQHYPDTPILFMTDKEWGMFKKQYDTINLHDHKLEDVLTWIVTDWERLMKGDMAWMHKYESSLFVPTVRTLCRFFRKFVEVYSSDTTRTVQHDGDRAVALITSSKNKGGKEDEISKLQAKLDAAGRETAKALRDRDIAQAAARVRQKSSTGYSDDLPEWDDSDGK